MKGLKVFFLVLLGFLFVSDAGAKTDIQVNDGFEVVINVHDLDIETVDNAIKTPVNYSNYLVINVSRDIIIKTQKTNLSNCIAFLMNNSKGAKAYVKSLETIKTEVYSNSGKLNLPVNIINRLNLGFYAVITSNKKGGCLDTGELNKPYNYII